MKALLPLLIFAVSLMVAGNARAQDEDPFARIVRENQERQHHAVDGLGLALDSLADEIRYSKTIVRAVMLVECNTIVRITRIYGDGHVVVTDVGDIQATNAELAEQAASYPFMQIVSACSK